MGMSSEGIWKSTLGDLIVAVTDETACFVQDEEELYKVVAYIVSDLLHNSRPPSRWWH